MILGYGELGRIALVPAQKPVVDRFDAVLWCPVVGLQPRIHLQVRWQLLRDSINELIPSQPLVHVANGLVVEELDGVPIVRDPLHDELVANPRAHVRSGVAARVGRYGQETVDAFSPRLNVAVRGAAQGIQVRERLALDRLRAVHVTEIGKP